MAYEKNEMEYEAGAPKKADVLIRSTQHIALKQEEMSELTKQALARLDEAIELFSKSNNDASYVVKQSGEIFNQLQSENSALKQELLYLAKQSENIYAGLAEKITELSEQSKNRDESLSGLYEKINDVAGQTVKGDGVYSSIEDRLNDLFEQNKRYDKMFASIAEKLDAISVNTERREPVQVVSERREPVQVVSERREPVQVDNEEVLSKLSYISEQLRRNESAHSMLADKFEILSMRVEQFGFEGAKNSAPAYAQPVAYPAPVQTVVKENIDYDKLAEKVASLISVHDEISPDYLASKVAEQIVIPEVQSANVRVSVDTHEIAKEVAELVGTKNTGTVHASPAEVNLSINEDALAESLAKKLGAISSGEIAPASALSDIDEEELAERIAKKVGAFKSADINTASLSSASVNIDEEELADSIALKVGSLKAEDFEILVDDNGCNSISKEIADHFDYQTICDILADKLREALDLASVNTPDYEEMAERISEKITVAGINEDAIADKAAAVLSNYLPEFDVDEIADKVTGAVIDVVSAMPQPTIDSEAICNSISEKLIESQEDHDYDVVLDDEGITKITELVSEEIEKETGERFDKVEEQISKLCELIGKAQETKESVEETVDEQDEEQSADTEEITLGDYSKLSELIAAEIQKGTAERFDRVEDDIAKLTDMVASAVEEGDYEDGYEEYPEDDLSAISEAVVTEIERSFTNRLDSVEENIAKITELLSESDKTSEVEDVEGEANYDGEYKAEIDYNVLVTEIEKNLAPRFESVEECINKLSEIITIEDELPEEEAEGETDEAEEELVEEDYTALTEAVVAEIEKSLAPRLESVEDSINKLTEIITVEDELPEEGAEGETDEAEEEYEVEEDYTALTEAVVAEIEKSLAPRLDSVEDSINKLTEIITVEDELPEEEAEGETDEAEEEYEVEEDYTALVAEIERSLAPRLESVEENIAKITEILSDLEEVPEEEAEGEAEYDGEYDAEEDYTALVAEIERSLAPRLDSVEENIAKITEILSDLEEVPEEEAEGEADEAEEEYEVEEDYTALVAEIERSLAPRLESVEEVINNRLDNVERGITNLTGLVTAGVASEVVSENIANYPAVIDYTAVSEAVATEIKKSMADRLDSVEENIAKITDIVTTGVATEIVTEKVEEDYSAISDVVSAEIERGVASRLDSVEQNIAKITELVTTGAVAENVAESTASPVEVDYTAVSEAIAEEVKKSIADRLDNVEEAINSRLDNVEDNIAIINEKVTNGAVAENVAESTASPVEVDYTAVSEAIAEEVKKSIADRLDNVEENLAKISDIVSEAQDANARFDKIEEDVAKISDKLQSDAQSENEEEDNRLNKFEDDLAQIKTMLAGGIIVNSAKEETAAAQAQEVVEEPEEQPEEEQELVKVSDLVEPEPEAFEEDEEEEEEEAEGEDNEDDFLIDVLDMDRFSDNELMPGELSDYAGGVDFANMMKFKRSFIARIIQSSDDYKQYYGEVKHALISYKKVNSNVAWGAERFNKGRETIARMKIRGKTLCLYLALDPNEYKTSVYHHLDVSDNKSVSGTPMMVKVKSNLGVRKAIRLIDEMLAKRNGEKKEIPERNYAAMYPYETIEELIEDGLVKDVRKK